MTIPIGKGGTGARSPIDFKASWSTCMQENMSEVAIPFANSECFQGYVQLKYLLIEVRVE